VRGSLRCTGHAHGWRFTVLPLLHRRAVLGFLVLDEGMPDTFPDARAAAADLALRAAQTLVVASGSSSILTDHHPQRLAREALFLQVFGQRPPIRTALLSRLTTPTP
jgi:hypothetical protein